jgi:hypothetical protein
MSKPYERAILIELFDIVSHDLSLDITKIEYSTVFNSNDNNSDNNDDNNSSSNNDKNNKNNNKNVKASKKNMVTEVLNVQRQTELLTVIENSNDEKEVLELKSFLKLKDLSAQDILKKIKVFFLLLFLIDDFKYFIIFNK